MDFLNLEFGKNLLLEWIMKHLWLQKNEIMTIEQLNSSKVPIIVIDKRLEQFRDEVLFPEKLKKANEILSKVGLPKRKK